MDPHPETAENLAGYFKIPGKVLFLRTYFIEPGGCGAIRREPEKPVATDGPNYYGRNTLRLHGMELKTLSLAGDKEKGF